jgi:hypothetical protein
VSDGNLNRWLREEIRVGRCFEAGLPGRTPHLWIILAVEEEDGVPVSVVLANLTTQRASTDPTVVLQRGDHPYVMHPSCVLYAEARIADADKVYVLTRYAEEGFRQDFHPEILRRLQCGLLSSPHTPRNVKAFCAGRFDCE